MPPAIPPPSRDGARIPPAHSGKALGSHHTSSSSGRQPTDLSAVPRSSSSGSNKVLHTTKGGDPRKDHTGHNVKHSSGRGGGEAGRHHKPLDSQVKPSASLLESLKPVFLPDVNGRPVIKADLMTARPSKSKASSDGGGTGREPGGGSASHARGAHQQTSSSSKHSSSQQKLHPAEMTERPTSRSGRQTELPRRYRSDIPEHDGARGAAGDSSIRRSSSSSTRATDMRLIRRKFSTIKRML